MLVLSVVVAGFLARRASSTPAVVTLYWFPVVAPTVIGVLPAPRRASTG